MGLFRWLRGLRGAKLYAFIGVGVHVFSYLTVLFIHDKILHYQVFYSIVHVAYIFYFKAFSEAFADKSKGFWTVCMGMCVGNIFKAVTYTLHVFSYVEPVFFVISIFYLLVEDRLKEIFNRIKKKI